MRRIMGIYPACSGAATLFCQLSLSHQILSPSLQPSLPLATPRLPCRHCGGSKRLTEENQAFFPIGARQNLNSGLVTSELSLSRLDTLRVGPHFLKALRLWTFLWPLGNSQNGQKLKSTLY